MILCGRILAGGYNEMIINVSAGWHNLDTFLPNN